MDNSDFNQQQHYHVHVDEGDGFCKLKDVLSVLCANLTLIYVDSYERSQSLCRQLSDCRCPTMTMDPSHDLQHQKDRVQAFKNEVCMVLIATDDTAGLIMEAGSSEIHVIIHMDRLKSLDQYLARMGRSNTSAGDRLSERGPVVIYFSNNGGDDQVLASLKTELGINIQPFDDDHSDDEHC